MDLSIRTETYYEDDHSWLASAHGTDATRTITLDVSAFTSGAHYPRGYLPSGLPLGRIAATGLYGPYDPNAGDGRQVLAGFLFASIKAPASSSIDVAGALLEHGKVIASKLPVTLADPDEAQASAAGRIIFVDRQPTSPSGS